jgi:hypothetical protein
MTCPIKSTIPSAVWSVESGMPINSENARAGLMGYVKTPSGCQTFIIVWVGDGEIGVIYPFLCQVDDNISFGPDSTETGNVMSSEYNVRKLKIGDDLYTGISIDC